VAKNRKSESISRRDLLFGAVKKLRREDEWREIREEEQAKSRETANLLQEGNQLLEQGDYEAAIEKFRACVAKDTTFLEARRRLGYCLYRTGKYIQARVEFERVLYTRKKDNFSSLYLGLCMARLGKADKAAVVWKGYFNPDEIAIQRELNLQAAMLETENPPEPGEMADAVEEVVERRKHELMEDPGP
jgi:tetratricopeptide (TPR) repeat protein